MVDGVAAGDRDDVSSVVVEVKGAWWRLEIHTA